MGFDVSIICLRNEISYPYKGKLYNLGVDLSRIKLIKQFSKLIKFKLAYHKTNADYYIDFRVRSRFWMELLLNVFIFDVSKMIFSIRSYNIHLHIPKSKWFYKSYNKAHAIVGPSKDIISKMKSIHPFQNLEYIPNFYTSSNQSTKPLKLSINTPYVLAVGRLDNSTKQFDKLIDTYSNTILVDDKIPLIIVGEGKDRSNLEEKIKLLRLEDLVFLEGFKKEVFSYMESANFLVMSSYVEGFPNTLLESLVVGTPVVSFDCHSGPSEIVKNKSNGLLVKSQNFEALTEAMNLMYEDKALYKKCKSNSKNSVEKFSFSNISPKWLDLLQ
jgi:N-acetylgalactosamine-N,N'-diacetylbacillosaminyl-diphospho-undecaprenol 4-alpha-N-acetylgalactosaminyltransferase